MAYNRCSSRALVKVSMIEAYEDRPRPHKASLVIETGDSQRRPPFDPDLIPPIGRRTRRGAVSQRYLLVPVAAVYLQHQARSYLGKAVDAVDFWETEKHYAPPAKGVLPCVGFGNVVKHELLLWFWIS